MAKPECEVYKPKRNGPRWCSIENFEFRLGGGVA
jgi:hypothetical protein